MSNLTQNENKNVILNVREILRDTGNFIIKNPRFILCLFVVNMVFMMALKVLPGGISHPLSILWFVCYYIYWCFFYRYYYRLHPYLLCKAVFASLNPSGKAVLILFFVAIFVAYLPMLPLLFGFDDVYLDIYERYLKSYDGLSMANEIHASLGDVLMFYTAMVLVLPLLVCKPYLAWISSLRGMNASFAKVKQKIKGNYWHFVLISAILIYPDAIGTFLDQRLNCQGWLEYVTNTLTFIFTNVIFAKIYDYLYIKH